MAGRRCPTPGGVRWPKPKSPGPGRLPFPKGSWWSFPGRALGAKTSSFPFPLHMQATPSEAEALGESSQSYVSAACSDWTGGKPVSLLAPLIPPRSSGQPLPFGPSGRQPLRSLLVGMCSGSGRRRSSLSPTMRPGTGAERGGLMVSEMESQPPSRGPGDGERRLSGSSLCSSSWVSADGFLRRRPSVRDRRGWGKRHNENPSQRNRKLSPKGEDESIPGRAPDGGLRPKGEKWRAGTHKEGCGTLEVPVILA